MKSPGVENVSSRRPAVRGAGVLFGAIAVGVVALTGSASLTGFAHPPAYKDGPPPGFTGGFGEASCHACHFEADLNAPAGLLTLEGAPDRYTPGQTYPLTVTLSRPAMKLAGFQLAARLQGGGQAGSLRIDSAHSERAAVTTSGNIIYAYQREIGSQPSGEETSSWTILWTAPQASESVIFHVAANAADGDDSVAGDFVYTTEHTTSPR
jgi:hypothetical protein